jgi:hypothetical protein
MSKPPRKKLDPSLVRLSVLVIIFFFGFVVAVLTANQAGKKEANRQSPSVPGDVLAPTR